MVAPTYRAWILLPLAVCAGLLPCAGFTGCGQSAENAAPQDSRELAAPALLRLVSRPKPLLAAQASAISPAAHSETPRILELSAAPGASPGDLIREPTAAGRMAAPQSQAAASVPAERYPAQDYRSEVSHAPPDNMPYLASRPRYEDVPADRPSAAYAPAAPAVQGSSAPEYEITTAANAPAPSQPAPYAPQAYHQVPAPQLNPAQIAARQAAMQSVADRAAEISSRGFSMAQRGMLYAGRAELLQSLQLVAQALDVQQGTAEHSAALAAGLAALKEAEDFASAGQIAAVVDVAALAAAHSTPVLKSAAAEGFSPVVAQQQYLAYAQSQLIVAAGRQPVASQSLYRLGRVQSAMAAADTHQHPLAGPQAMVFQQAALGVDGRNYLAANELGVLMARYGQWAEARRLLLHSVTLQPHAEGWHNLAVVHRKLGEADLARRADYERGIIASRQAAAPAGDSLIRWVDTRTFAASAGSEAPWPEASAPSKPQTAVRGSASAGLTR